MKRQVTDQEKMFVHHIFEIWLVARIYEELFKLNSKVQKKNPIRKMGKRHEQTFQWWEDTDH